MISEKARKRKNVKLRLNLAIFLYTIYLLKSRSRTLLREIQNQELFSLFHSAINLYENGNGDL